MTQKRICVIGAGVIGLSSAIRLQNSLSDVDITLMADTFSPNTTSDGSAGFWEPHLVNIDQKEDIRKWGQETFDYILSLVSSEEGGKIGAQLLSGYDFSSNGETEDPFWKDQVFAYRKLNKHETQIHPENKGGISFTTVSIDVKSYLPWLMQKFRAKGGKVCFKTISSFSEIADDFDVIVNCVGMRASVMLNDQSMTPIRGQVMRVYAPWIKHFYLDFDQERGLTYIIPGRDSVVLGGTGQIGNWSTDVDSADKLRIWEGCVNLVPSLKIARPISDWVGLRPSRSKVRLELEEVKGKNRKYMVVHNYGHSGSGVTLHWGCAGEAVKLVQTALRKLSLTSHL